MATVMREVERKYDPAQAKELQQLLGDHHDSVVALAVLLDLAAKARAAGEDTFTYGLMHQRQAFQAATIEQALPRFTGARRDRTRAPDRRRQSCRGAHICHSPY